MSGTLKTNHHVRDVLRWDQLTDKEREWFDYLDTDDKRDEATFARYRGSVYDLGEVEIASHEIKALGFDGMHVDSAFSATVFGYFDRDGNEWEDGVVVGFYYV
jgi:hypothetical protein